MLVVIKCLGFGGAERLLVDTVVNGDRSAFEYEVAYVLAAEDGLVPELRAHGIEVHSLGATGNVDVRWVWRLRDLVAAGRYDVVHFHLPYTAALGRLATASLPRATRPRIVYTEHSLWNRMAVLVKVLNRATIGLDQSLIVVSEAARDALPAALKGRARVIVHSVDLTKSDALVARHDELRRAVRDELGVPEGHLLAITVANLRAEKGYDVLVEAVALLCERDVPVTIAAAGRGPLEGDVRTELCDRGLDGRLKLLGHRDDVLELLCGSDVFVLASRQEGLPVALMEATSVGLPIVATAVGGVPQVLTDGVDGMVVPPGRPSELADAIQRLVDDPELRKRLGAAAKERSSMFDVSSACREIEGIYRALVAAPL